MLYRWVLCCTVKPVGTNGQERLIGTLISRKRKDGSTGYTALITLKQGGKIAHREAKTFDRRQAANAWMERRESELRKPGGLDRKEDPKLVDVIEKYIAESKREIGRTKSQVLRTIKTYDIADMRCSEITSANIVSFAQSLPAGPATVQNYLSHLSAIFAVARPAWGYPLDRQAIQDAFVVTKRLGVTAKGKQRDRRDA